MPTSKRYKIRLAAVPAAGFSQQRMRGAGRKKRKMMMGRGRLRGPVRAPTGMFPQPMFSHPNPGRMPTPGRLWIDQAPRVEILGQ